MLQANKIPKYLRILFLKSLMFFLIYQRDYWWETLFRNVLYVPLMWNFCLLRYSLANVLVCHKPGGILDAKAHLVSAHILACSPYYIPPLSDLNTGTSCLSSVTLPGKLFFGAFQHPKLVLTSLKRGHGNWQETRKPTLTFFVMWTALEWKA